MRRVRRAEICIEKIGVGNEAKPGPCWVKLSSLIQVALQRCFSSMLLDYVCGVASFEIGSLEFSEVPNR